MELSHERKLEILKEILLVSKREGECLICKLGPFGPRRRPIKAINLGNGLHRNILVTRLIMYLVKDFDINSDLFILHDNKCLSYKCIEPDHLRPGTASENTMDMIDKTGHNRENGIRKDYCKRGHLRVPKNLWKNGTCKLCDELHGEERKRKRALLKSQI